MKYVKLNFVGDVFLSEKLHTAFSRIFLGKPSGETDCCKSRLVPPASSLSWGGGACARPFSQYYTVVPNVKKPPKISQPKVISRFFPWKFVQIHITSVFGCMHFTYKICQTVAGTSMIHRFHEFFESRFWRFFCNFAQLCSAKVGGDFSNGARAYLLRSPSSLAGSVVLLWTKRARARIWSSCAHALSARKLPPKAPLRSWLWSEFLDLSKYYR